MKFPYSHDCHALHWRHSLRGLCGLKFLCLLILSISCSHSLRGLCGLKCHSRRQPALHGDRHSLRGLCGLKCLGPFLGAVLSGSQPARAVWIEILITSANKPIATWSQPARAVWIEIHNKQFPKSTLRKSQPARAVWIEMMIVSPCSTCWAGHSLRGLCGLKLCCRLCPGIGFPSQPARAVWIEI